jgi:hypothetical protein
VSERVFGKHLAKAGFTDIEIFDRRGYSIDDLAPYPLFPDSLLEALRQLLPPNQAGNLATAVTIRARVP